MSSISEQDLKLPEYLHGALGGIAFPFLFINTKFMSIYETSIVLKKGKEASVLRFHPWVFSGAIARIEGNKPQDGDLVQVQSSTGEFLGSGHYHQGSISVRLLSFDNRPIDEGFWIERIEAARTLRHSMGFAQEGNQKLAYRLIHGEGDGCSGLIIDIYGDVAVFQAHSIGMHKMREQIADALRMVYGLDIRAVYDKSGNSLPKNYARQAQFGYLFDHRAESLGSTRITEHGLDFQVNWEEGQKTGFFLDQRDNRAYLEQYCKDKRVLNAFCYSGGFSMQALAAGASHVDSVDVSAKAIALCDANAKLNGLEARHESHCADVLKFLQEAEQPWDVMVLDPPAYAKRLDKRHQAIQGYKRLNAQGLRKVKKGGLLFTFSCSQVVSRDLFQGAVLAGALEAKRQVRIVKFLGQSADHPIGLFHPEGNYLKGLLLYVE